MCVAQTRVIFERSYNKFLGSFFEYAGAGRRNVFLFTRNRDFISVKRDKRFIFVWRKSGTNNVGRTKYTRNRLKNIKRGLRMAYPATDGGISISNSGRTYYFQRTRNNNARLESLRVTLARADHRGGRTRFVFYPFSYRLRFRSNSETFASYDKRITSGMYSASRKLA